MRRVDGFLLFLIPKQVSRAAPLQAGRKTTGLTEVTPVNGPGVPPPVPRR
jgi:hypothetical protein